MKTEFILLAVYEKPLIPLETFCKDVMGIALKTARNRISAGTFQVPITRTDGGMMIHITDAARYIDKQRESAA